MRWSSSVGIDARTNTLLNGQAEFPNVNGVTTHTSNRRSALSMWAATCEAKATLPSTRTIQPGTMSNHVISRRFSAVTVAEYRPGP